MLNRERLPTISSSDPMAVQKLQERLEYLNKTHKSMVMANKIVRSERPKKVEALTERGWELVEAMQIVDQNGFSVEDLRNSATRRDQVRKRIKFLRESRRKGANERDVVPGVVYYEDAKKMRLGFMFKYAAIPREVSRYFTKRGFWYSMERGAFERHLSKTSKPAAANARLFLRRFASESGADT